MICTRIGVLSSFRNPTLDTIGDIYVENVSLDISITGVTINSNSITYLSGKNFPVGSGESGNYTTLDLGTYTVVISYTFSIAGQSLLFIDSNSNSTCHTPGSGTFTINNAVIDTVTTVGVFANDGACV